MRLELFDFIEDAVILLEKNKSLYVPASNYIEEYFETLLSEPSEGYLNINCRVKTANSLREKLIRNNYYKEFATPKEAINHLSDIIGVRIECRFSSDEFVTYEVLKQYFTENAGDGYCSSPNNKKVLLDMRGVQPQKQRNGFEIYRIDGLCKYDRKQVKFELQIKSLVNMFWGEIEHKVIYKNNNYMLMDKLFKDMMVSIKENLSMIDNQLMILYNQFNKPNALRPEERRSQIQSVMSKIIYDIFASRMKSEIGYLVDFRKSCDTIMKYIFRSSRAESVDDYSDVLVKSLARVNEITKNEIEFTSYILFERELKFKDKFEEIVGNTILSCINTDFHWNLFFRVLFEIEKGNNAEDFEAFLTFFKDNFYDIKTLNKLFYYFEMETAKSMIDGILVQIAEAFKEVNSIKFVYEDSVNDITEYISSTVNEISATVKNAEAWEENKNKYMEKIKNDVMELID